VLTRLVYPDRYEELVAGDRLPVALLALRNGLLINASAIISASLWPPPAKWSARSGFQPTNATANGRLRAIRATKATIASMLAAAIARNAYVAARAESAVSETPSATSVHTGP